MDVAGPLFARKGFEGATVREIVEAAGVNIAAVNYYFQGKQGLYNAVLTEAYAKLLAATRVEQASDDSLVPVDADRARVHLTNFIAGMVERALSNQQPHWLFAIMMREMVAPTQALDQMVARFIQPQHDANRAAIAAITGLAPDEPRVILAAYSIVAQVLFYKHCPQVVQRLTPVDTSSPQARAAIAQHITRFSLAGLDSLNPTPHERPAPAPASPLSTRERP